LTVIQQLANDLGAPDAGSADFYTTLIQIINNSNQADIPYPTHARFVSNAWSSTDGNPDYIFTDINAAINSIPNPVPTGQSYDVIVFPGVYSAVTLLPPNINLYGYDTAVIGGLTITSPAVAGEQVNRIKNFAITGPVSINTTGKFDTANVAVLFTEVIFDQQAVTVTLRTDALGAALVEPDAVLIDDSFLIPSSLTVSSVGLGLTLAKFIVWDSQVSLLGASSFTGVLVPTLMASRAKAKSATTSTRPRTRNLLPIGTPVFTLYVEFSNIREFLLAGNLTITTCNTLLESIFFSDSTIAVSSILQVGGILNASDVVFQTVLLALSGGANAALMHCAYSEAQISAALGSAIDRNLVVGTIAAAATPDIVGGFGLDLAVNPAFVNATFAVQAAVVGAAVIATPTVPVVHTTTSVAEYALSSAALAGGTLISYALHQQTAPLTFL
jgi:hypothetical protein